MKKTFISQVKETLITIGIALVLALIIRAFILQTFYIPTGSMMPTIMPGDRVIALKFWYYFVPPKRGDIVVFKSPEEPKILVKRLIGLPGDTVLIRDGKIYINGKLWKDKRIANIRYYAIGPYGVGEQKVPLGKYYMLGDNSENSDDSRFWGFVPRKNILGKVVFTYWPVTHIKVLY